MGNTKLAELIRDYLKVDLADAKLLNTHTQPFFDFLSNENDDQAPEKLSRALKDDNNDQYKAEYLNDPDLKLVRGAIERIRIVQLIQDYLKVGTTDEKPLDSHTCILYSFLEASKDENTPDYTVLLNLIELDPQLNNDTNLADLKNVLLTELTPSAAAINLTPPSDFQQSIQAKSQEVAQDLDTFYGPKIETAKETENLTYHSKDVLSSKDNRNAAIGKLAEADIKVLTNEEDEAYLAEDSHYILPESLTTEANLAQYNIALPNINTANQAPPWKTLVALFQIKCTQEFVENQKDRSDIDLSLAELPVAGKANAGASSYQENPHPIITERRYPSGLLDFIKTKSKEATKTFDVTLMPFFFYTTTKTLLNGAQLPDLNESLSGYYATLQNVEAAANLEAEAKAAAAAADKLDVKAADKVKAAAKLEELESFQSTIWTSSLDKLTEPPRERLSNYIIPPRLFSDMGKNKGTLTIKNFNDLPQRGLKISDIDDTTPLSQTNLTGLRQLFPLTLQDTPKEGDSLKTFLTSYAQHYQKDSFYNPIRENIALSTAQTIVINLIISKSKNLKELDQDLSFPIGMNDFLYNSSANNNTFLKNITDNNARLAVAITQDVLLATVEMRIPQFYISSEECDYLRTLLRLDANPNNDTIGAVLTDARKIPNPTALQAKLILLISRLVTRDIKDEAQLAAHYNLFRIATRALLDEHKIQKLDPGTIVKHGLTAYNNNPVNERAISYFSNQIENLSVLLNYPIQLPLQASLKAAAGKKNITIFEAELISAITLFITQKVNKDSTGQYFTDADIQEQRNFVTQIKTLFERRKIDEQYPYTSAAFLDGINLNRVSITQDSFVHNKSGFKGLFRITSGLGYAWALAKQWGNFIINNIFSPFQTAAEKSAIISLYKPIPTDSSMRTEKEKAKADALAAAAEAKAQVVTTAEVLASRIKTIEATEPGTELHTRKITLLAALLNYMERNELDSGTMQNLLIKAGLSSPLTNETTIAKLNSNITYAEKARYLVENHTPGPVTVNAPTAPQANMIPAQSVQDLVASLKAMEDAENGKAQLTLTEFLQKYTNLDPDTNKAEMLTALDAIRDRYSDPDVDVDFKTLYLQAARAISAKISSSSTLSLTGIFPTISAARALQEVDANNPQLNDTQTLVNNAANTTNTNNHGAAAPTTSDTTTTYTGGRRNSIPPGPGSSKV
jgi:hypothetical protein